MLSEKDAAKVYDTILSIPGMNDMVKVDFKMSRKNVLLLQQVISNGLNGIKETDSGSLLATAKPESLQELNAFSEECLDKAGLKELSEKLSLLNSK